MNKPVFTATYELPLCFFIAPKEKLAEPEGPSDAVAIGAGVGGTVAVLAVIAVVAFIVVKRRGKSLCSCIKNDRHEWCYY